MTESIVDVEPEGEDSEDTQAEQVAEPEEGEENQGVLITDDDEVIIKTHDEIVAVGEYNPEAMPERPDDQLDENIEREDDDEEETPDAE